jgi:hypothetical protein
VALISGGAVIPLGLGLYLPKSSEEPWRTLVDLFFVAGFSGLVAYGELVSRYRDSVVQLISAPPTPVYLLANIAAGIGALLIVHRLGIVSDTRAPRLYEVMLASFGAVAFFRSSLLTVRVGGTDIGIGPSALLQALLGAADRMIDRDQAQGRGTDVAGIMRKVCFAKAQVALPTLCFTLVEDMAPSDQKGVSDQIRSLAEAADIRDAKAIILGVYLIRQVGADVLELAVQALGPEISRDPPPSPAAPLPPTG